MRKNRLLASIKQDDLTRRKISRISRIPARVRYLSAAYRGCYRNGHFRLPGASIMDKYSPELEQLAGLNLFGRPPRKPRSLE
jgi:hypothetical protein